MNRVVVLEGKCWHLIPQATAAPVEFPSWHEDGDEFVLLSYGKDGKLLVGKELPPLPIGWTVQPFLGMEGWTAYFGNWKWTLLHEFPDGVCVFAGITI